MTEIHTTFFNFSEVELLSQILPNAKYYEFTSEKIFRMRETPTCTCGCKCVYNGFEYARKKHLGKVKIGKYICQKCCKQYRENKGFWKNLLAEMQEAIMNIQMILRDANVSYRNISSIMNYLIPESKDKIYKVFNQKMDNYNYEVNENILIVHYDEQHPKRGRTQKFRLTLLNAKDKSIIADKLCENKNRETIKEFLLEHLDISKDIVIITDCARPYPEIFRELWGNRIRHQKCLLHLNKLICYDSGKNTNLIDEYNKYLLLDIFYDRSVELKKIDRLMKKQEKQNFKSKQEKREWIQKAKHEFWDFLKKRENRRRRKGKNLKQRTLKDAEDNFAKILFQRALLSKKLQKRIEMVKENWDYFTTFYHVEGCPATNNCIENYYSISLKTHRKKQFRTDRGLENQMKLAAIKRKSIFYNPKETLFEVYLKIYLVAT